MGGIVVHHQVQLAFGVDAGDLLEESQELLVPVPRLTRRRDLTGADLQRREQGRGALRT
jgi:hypothetical protein